MNGEVDPVYAVVRRTAFDPDRLAAGGAALAEFDEQHAAQPGFLGTLVVEERDGRRLVVNLWRSEEDATAALAVLRLQVGRLLEPLMSEPSELIGSGTVIATDLGR